MKDTEIFELRKEIEQMKIQFHCSELRHNEDLKTFNLKWETKYKNLFDDFKALQKNMSQKSTKFLSHKDF